MGNILGNKSKTGEINFEIRYKIKDEKVPDSEIIRDIECAKCEDPKFDINYVDYYIRWSLLIRAVLWNRKELVKYILADSNIDVNHKDNDGYTAFYYACWHGYIPILKLLLYHRDIDVNIQNEKDGGLTGLHYACWRNHIEIVKELLLDARVDVLIRNNLGKTSRDKAIYCGHLGIANMLKKVLCTSLLRIPNETLLHDIVRMIIEEYT